jgi:transposase
LLLAVSPVLGVVAYLIFPGSMNNNVFFMFLRELVLPALAQGSAKFIMLDNHAAHKKEYIKDYVHAKGHLYQYRPTHSPDFSPVELCFAEIKAFLKTNEAFITPSTIVEWVTHAVASLTTTNIKKYCAHSHYLVTGEDYKPYLGWQ